MDYTVIGRAFLFFLLLILFAVLLQLPQPAAPQEDKVVLEVRMIPVDDEDGVFVLEYSNGVREVLQKDGTRILLKELPK